MAQISGLQILCVYILLLGAGCEGGSSPSLSSLSSAALSDSESYTDECKYIECPEIPETEATEEVLCPADSIIDIKEFDYIQLNPLTFSHDTRAKRDLQSKCCNTQRCRCNQCPKRPQCKTDEVLIELSPGTGQPGSCCAQYECGKEPECEGKAITYWLTQCYKCISCKLPCINECHQSDQIPSNCLSDSGEMKLNGQSWIEGNGCVECTCSNGQKDCQVPGCKQLKCKNPIKLPDSCCEVCPAEAEETSSSTAATTSTTTTEAAELPSSTTSQAIEISIKKEIPKEVIEPEEENSTISSSTTSESAEETTTMTAPINVEELSIESEIPEIENTEELLMESVEKQLQELAGRSVTQDSLETEITEELPSATSSTTLKKEEEKEMEKEKNEEEKVEEKKEEKEEKEKKEEEQEKEKKEEEKEEKEKEEEEGKEEKQEKEKEEKEKKKEKENKSGKKEKKNEEEKEKEEKEEKENEEEKEEQTANYMEDTTLTALDNPEVESESSTFSTSSTSTTSSTSAPSSTLNSSTTITTEHPGALATSSPAALTPESTSWLRDTNINDSEYRMANASRIDALHPTNLKYVMELVGGIIVLALLIFFGIVWQRRKTMYSSVPHSDCNLSENTNTSDLVLCIDQPDDHNLPQKPLKESVE